MVKISIADARATFDVQGWHKLLAFKSKLEIPLAHIRAVRSDPAAARSVWKGLRLPGTHVPGLLAAGTYYSGGKRSFWDVRRPDRAIVVELSDESYDRLIIEVEDPTAEVERLKPNAPS
jgi:hypothetical protein